MYTILKQKEKRTQDYVASYAVVIDHFTETIDLVVTDCEPQEMLEQAQSDLDRRVK